MALLSETETETAVIFMPGTLNGVAEAMILMNLSLEICAAHVEVEEISRKNLEMMVVMKVVKMVVMKVVKMVEKIVAMNKKSTANANVMLMIEHAGLDATYALKISSEANLTKEKSHPHQLASSARMSVKHVLSI